MLTSAVLALLATAALFDIWRNIQYYMHKNDPDPDELIACFEKNMVTSFSETYIKGYKLKKNGSGIDIVLVKEGGLEIKSVVPIKCHWFKNFNDGDKVCLLVSDDVVIFRVADIYTVLDLEGDFV